MNRLSLKWQTPPICHCEGALRPLQSREGSCVFAEGFPMIQLGTARLLRPLRGLAMTNLGACDNYRNFLTNAQIDT